MSKLHRQKIQNIAKFIEGIIVASFPGVQYGPLHYRALEMAKTTHLKLNFGNYEALVTLPDDCKSEFKWWIENKKVGCPQWEGVHWGRMVII